MKPKYYLGLLLLAVLVSGCVEGLSYSDAYLDIEGAVTGEGLQDIEGAVTEEELHEDTEGVTTLPEQEPVVDAYALLETEEYSDLEQYRSDLGFKATVSWINDSFARDQHKSLLDLLLQVQGSAKDNWMDFSKTLHTAYYSEEEYTLGLVLWKDSPHFEEVVEFIITVQKPASRDWKNFARVIGRSGSGLNGGLILWKDSPHLGEVLEFATNVQDSAGEDWRGFATFIGLSDPDGSAGLILWKDSPHLGEVLEFATNVQDSAGEDWWNFAALTGMTSSYVATYDTGAIVLSEKTGLIAWKNSPHFEELLDVLQQHISSTTTSSLTNTLNDATGDYSAFKRAVQ